VFFTALLVSMVPLLLALSYTNIYVELKYLNIFKKIIPVTGRGSL
jgi:hypothetical protein